MRHDDDLAIRMLGNGATQVLCDLNFCVQCSTYACTIFQNRRAFNTNDEEWPDDDRMRVDFINFMALNQGAMFGRVVVARHRDYTMAAEGGELLEVVGRGVRDEPPDIVSRIDD